MLLLTAELNTLEPTFENLYQEAMYEELQVRRVDKGIISTLAVYKQDIETVQSICIKPPNACFAQEPFHS